MPSGGGSTEYARPSEPVETPARATYVALLVSHDERALELEHVTALCRELSAEPPDDGTTHFATTLHLSGDDTLRLKWERHGEFSSYTVVAGGTSRAPFSDPAASLLPDGWLARVPGQTMVAAHAELLPAPEEPPDVAPRGVLRREHAGRLGGRRRERARVHRLPRPRRRLLALLVMDRRFAPVQAGRTLQRLFEIEAYRMLALLSLPIARAQSPKIAAIERWLAQLADDMIRGRDDDERLLNELTRLAAEIESELAVEPVALRRVARLRRARDARGSPSSASGGFRASRRSRSSWRAA